MLGLVPEPTGDAAEGAGLCLAPSRGPLGDRVGPGAVAPRQLRCSSFFFLVMARAQAHSMPGSWRMRGRLKMAVCSFPPPRKVVEPHRQGLCAHALREACGRKVLVSTEQRGGYGVLSDPVGQGVQPRPVSGGDPLIQSDWCPYVGQDGSVQKQAR